MARKSTRRTTIVIESEKSDFLEDLTKWQEPMTGGVSCEYLPVDYSCDNSVTFTAEKYALLGCSGIIPEFDYFLHLFEKSPGELLRHPTSSEVTSWDDHLAAAAMSPWMAQRIYYFGTKNGWTWGGKWLGRFPIFKPTVKASAGIPLSILDSILIAGTFLANCLEKKEETSGKNLCYLASKALYGHSRLIDLSIRIWRRVMANKYPNAGLREVMGIYFPAKQGVLHPLSFYAPESFK